MAGLYLHIPFCRQACYYCDFHFSTDLSQRVDLVNAMVHELIAQKEYLKGETIKTIYLGGGTPSLLAKKEIDSLLSAVITHFPVAHEVEITLEANPDDLSKEKLKELKASGINRLSVGIQSFDDRLLKFLNRAHHASAARQCLHDVREAGFSNISLDLMYAIPDLSDKLWNETIQEALRFSPEHISTYALTLEERTVFGNWRKKGKLKMVEEETEARQFEMLMEVLTPAGYEQYEISNFSKPGFISQHNSSYWKQFHYLGIGPSAHSFDGVSRQFNILNNALYIRSIRQGTPSFEREVLSRENKINEYILTMLRTVWGCDLRFLKRELNDDLMMRSGEYIHQITQQGLVYIEGETLKLTRKGNLLADKIAEDLMVIL